MQEHQEYLDLIPSYTLGALDGDELRQLEEHLAGDCPECRRELFEATRQMELLAELVPPVSPSQTTRARLLRQIGSPSRPKPREWLTRAAVIGGVAILAWSIWLQLGLRREVDRLVAARNETIGQLELVRTELLLTQGRLQQTMLANRIAASPRMQSVVMAGLDPAPGASAHTFVDPVERRAVFYAANLPPAEEDKTYQLWFIADGVPVSAGIFDVDPEGGAMLLVERIAEVEMIQLWAVTIEPAGGVPQPTGDMVLKG
jgi:anti-sigma-K factor RskA